MSLNQNTLESLLTNFCRNELNGNVAISVVQYGSRHFGTAWC